MVDAEKPDNEPTVKPQQERDLPSTATGLVSSSLQRDDPTLFNPVKDVDEHQVPHARSASESSDTPPRTARSVSGGSDTDASSPLGESHAISTPAQTEAPHDQHRLVGGKQLLPPPPIPYDRTTLLSDTSSTPSVNELANCPHGSVLQYEAGGHVLVSHAHRQKRSYSSDSPSRVIYGTPTDQEHAGNSPSQVVVSKARFSRST